MPELPEVETTRRGIEPYLRDHVVMQVIVRERRLRWPIPVELVQALRGQRIEAVERRAKYLLLRTRAGTAIVHLGMSGSLRVLPDATAPGKHDHLDLVLDSGQLLRLRDPRRFGAVLWTRDDPLRHPLLAELGPEPLSAAFDGARLYRLSRGRRGPVKNFVMDNRIVVGLGNIYANETLFRAGIHPLRAAGRIGAARYEKFADVARTVLLEAIAKGGTTLRDFTHADGNPGYFRIELEVYGHAGEPCPSCGATLKQTVIGQRSSVYCPHCQH
ncbi:bifunctional DNA-formamidopyrimidine glycosylase/DNA-(apurinic or apyrimidinic site) lyase [Acidihalobacter ferrooxydans]|uniref:Formamidopyrimidine-DNA glycosylase n=1 Tax=Acidihalobacter ferrooxydans TaxID=1765967 RepID=A0A1P8UDV0_9GAMM|nr:bifunctional DNA-formamidopyrimidine glycosylase/DNA-(apurinic or apyrimidinic site) lyase [Acidihalobacter ferrooxydans]APZ42041.1 DNA-formamidopyrimidine glycosylase [Acidihalobacter ferrooxydans]